MNIVVTCRGLSAKLHIQELTDLVKNCGLITVQEGSTVLVVGYNNEDIYLDITEEYINDN